MERLESLIIIILFILLSNLGNGKKRRSGRPQTRAGQQLPEMSDLPQQIFTEAFEDDGAAERRMLRQQAAGRYRRKSENKSTAQERDCGYCTGEIVVESSLAHHTAAAAAPKDSDTPYVDAAALQKEWGLSPLQNALVWQEILDKPQALRRRNIR